MDLVAYPKTGEIWLVNLEPTMGSEIKKLVLVLLFRQMKLIGCLKLSLLHHSPVLSKIIPQEFQFFFNHDKVVLH